MRQHGVIELNRLMTRPSKSQAVDPKKPVSLKTKERSANAPRPL
jgi:hypothetical protein